jgi:putative ABC transport system permease protein
MRRIHSFFSKLLTLEPAGTGVSPLRQRYERPLLAVMVVVGLVLLIACANIANLQLARAMARRHELSVRVALGASRWRLTRALLVESAMLAAFGALLGTEIALKASVLLMDQLSTRFDTMVVDLSLDWRVLIFTVVVALATTALFGVAPALRASAAPPSGVLNDQGRGQSESHRGALAGSLVVVQVALSLVLVVSAGLFVQTFAKLATRPLGFDTGRVAVVSVNAARAHVDAEHRIAFYYRLADALAAVPGVSHAAASVVSPISSAGIENFIEVPGAPPMPESERVSFTNFVTPGWFATYGTPILSGRDVDARDTSSGPQVVLVNEAFSRRYLPNKNPLGATVRFVPGRANEVQLPKTIIGVVADSVYRTMRETPPPIMYMPLTQWNLPFPMTGITFGVRSATDSTDGLARSLDAALTGVDRELTFNVRPLTDNVGALLTQERVVAVLSGAFGFLALVLAGLGLFGVTAYGVSRRRREIGIRLAIGATPAGVVRLVLTRATTLVIIGVVVGTVMSLWASQFVAALLYGVNPRDATTLVGAIVVLVAVGTAAGWVPAWRASRIDPAEVLRDA